MNHPRLTVSSQMEEYIKKRDYSPNYNFQETHELNLKVSLFQQPQKNEIHLLNIWCIYNCLDCFYHLWLDLYSSQFIRKVLFLSKYGWCTVTGASVV